MMRLKTTFVLLIFALSFSSYISAESFYKIAITDQTGNQYLVLHPEFTNGMKVRSGGLRFQKGQTSFLFKWNDIKSITNDGKSWTIKFSTGISDSFDLGISMDMLLGQIEDYGNKGEFQIYTRHVKTIETIAKIEPEPETCNKQAFHPPVEIVLQNGQKISGNFSQNCLFINSDETLVKVMIDEIAEIKIHNASRTFKMPTVD